MLVMSCAVLVLSSLCRVVYEFAVVVMRCAVLDMSLPCWLCICRVGYEFAVPCWL